ncbi:DUF6668 family protein [Streptomyces chromofuscus]|uniref:Uncharacterized protein n=1 Tax=Streptomyces chromofuscus TaxID=42881 RepID=A0A7M2T277_STRCW|nr:DUF6668 family protein [Streptomyces chromofuscus]QOV42344.1 hypothetical protein IPT68_21145 [Streptomyces chromofuscus]GGT34763.1 hypothetical protein GCM10010254_64060 [Streptomyces chromofuscus]
MRTGTRQGPEIWVRGPVAGAPEPEPAPLSARTARRFSWVGTHGGSGVSTLATVYGGQDCGRDWPGPADPRSVLLVARTHATGLACAVHALETFRRREVPAGLDLDAVVLVADAPGRLPRPLAQRIRLIESVIDVYRVPWVPAWRLGDLSGRPPRETEPLLRLTATMR